MNAIRRLIAWAKQVDWQHEPAVIMGVIKAVLAALAGAGLTVTDHQVAAITAYVTAGCLILAAFITRSKVSSPATTGNLKARLSRAAILAAKGAGQPAEDPVITDLIDQLGKTRMALNPAGDHPQYRLGRRINHDPRSRQFALPEPDAAATFKAVRWHSSLPSFDQGQVGSCTGNAAAGWLCTDDSSRPGPTTLPDGTPIDEKLALFIYSAAETIDGNGTYPPTDDGSSGLSVAKVLKQRGLCGDYSHAFSPGAAYLALQSGPVLFGTVWYQTMFDPKADGTLTCSKSSGVAGAHEILLDELEVDVNGQPVAVWLRNSWSPAWGVAGRARILRKDFEALLAADGDVTVPTPVVVPQPEPTPGPTPAPGPGDAGFLAAVGAYSGLAARLATNAAAHQMTVDDYAAWKLAGDFGKRH